MIEASDKGASDNPGWKTLGKGCKKRGKTDFSHMNPVVPHGLKQFRSSVMDLDFRADAQMLKNAFFHAVVQRKSFDPE